MSDQTILRAAKAGKNYEDLSQRVKTLISRDAWNKKVVEVCAKKRLYWHAFPSLKKACAQSEYHHIVLNLSIMAERLFPYHLVPPITTTPFTYYSRILHNALKKDKSYDRIPNFTAADIVRVTGIGRNEYVAMLNACKAKRILWKVNRDSVIRENLPNIPLDLQVEPWWTVRLVNNSQNSSGSMSTSSQSYKPHELSAAEKELLVTIQDAPESTIVLEDLSGNIWRDLYKKALIHIGVPISREDCIAVPPLEGFVSNKDASNDDDCDPVEKLLYAMFLAANARTTIEELAHVLDAPIDEVCEAASLACRLGFARRTTQRKYSFGGLQSSLNTTPLSSARSPVNSIAESEEQAIEVDLHKGIAFVVDTEVTATLMMGSLLKDQRHAVTLFEAGKLSGRLSVRELLDELSRVPDTGEGEVQFLVNTIKSLHSVLNLICSSFTSEDSASDSETDILRYEVLADLEPTTLNRMLSQHYLVVIFLTPTPSPLLSLQIEKEGPLLYGLPSKMAATPWLQLLIYSNLGRGPVSMIIPKGTHLMRLPTILAGGEFLLVKPWPTELARRSEIAIIAEKNSALKIINEELLTAALFIQVLSKSSLIDGQLVTVDWPLPCCDEEFEECNFSHHTDLAPLSKFISTDSVLGYVTFLRMGDATDEALSKNWAIYNVSFGMPVHSVHLCERICKYTAHKNLLDSSMLENSRMSMMSLKDSLQHLSNTYCVKGCEDLFLPSTTVVFDGTLVKEWNDHHNILPVKTENIEMHLSTVTFADGQPSPSLL